MIRTKTIAFRALALAAAAFSATGAVVTHANACGGEWYPYVEVEQVDYRPMVVSRAEKAVEEGRLQAAAGLILRAIPHLRDIKPNRAPITDRAHRVLAVATIRTSGALPVRLEIPQRIHGTWLGVNAEAREGNLKWAVGALQALEAKRSDPALQGEIAEGLALLGEHKEARETLERLAARDLISAPEAWATLAKLRAATGDTDGQQAAMKRCTAMAAEPTVCSEKPIPSAAS